MANSVAGALELVPHAAEIWDPSGTITFANAMFEQYVGFIAAEAIGTNAAELLHSDPEQHAEILAAYPRHIAAMFAIVTGLHVALSFPLSFYSGFVLEHRFGLSRQTFGRWLWRYAKRNLLVLAFGLAMFEGLYEIIWWTGPNWWWIAAVAFFAVSVVLGQLVPVLILPLFYKIDRIPPNHEAMRWIVESNPLSVIVENGRRALIWDEPLQWGRLGIVTLASLLIMQAGYALFMHLRREMADVH